MIGEISALGCAPLWALSSILMKSQTDKLDAFQINALRGLFASAFVIALVPITGRCDGLCDLSPRPICYLLLSTLVGIVLGDTLYIKGMALIGASKALPISITYPVFVLPFSVTIVGERLSIVTIGGVFITILGLLLVTAPDREEGVAADVGRKRYWRGVFFTLAASLCWAGGTTLLKFAMTDMDPILAGAIRMPFMTLVMFAAVLLRKEPAKVWRGGVRSLIILSLAGVLGIGVGGLLFMGGVKHAGPAKTAILSATAPLFGVPLSMVTLHERVTAKIFLGAVLCVIGVWFVI